ncbi:MAG: hypothetical protein QCI82_00440 [Candidatus Thermoplasmatota archaeon]|nr:hypothetical protein [Candidatus Thermoplasmatota archaeon]
MAGTAISELIFFVAALIVSSAVAVAFIDVADNYSKGLRDEAALLRADMTSSLTIVNDPGMVPYDNISQNLTFYIKNTGSSELSVQDVIVSANGTVSGGNGTLVLIVGGGSIWVPGSVVQVTFEAGGLVEGADYSGWASTSGLTEGGAPRGSALDTITFRIREV